MKKLLFILLFFISVITWALTPVVVQAEEGNDGNGTVLEPLALYDFRTGSGNTVYDISGYGEPLNLTIADTSAVHWREGGGLQIDSATIVSSGTPASKINDAVKASEEITVEAWVKPANTVQDGPARIVTLSADPYYRNFTLGQGLWEDQPSNLYDIRLWTSGTDTNGKPSLSSPAGSLTTALTHVVFTRDKSGKEYIYLNGTLAVSGTITGDLDGWKAYQLALGNEMSGDRPWLGTFRMVAFYDKAIDAAQVKRLNELGPDRVFIKLLALYDFTARSGDTVYDISGYGEPLNLTIADTSAVHWLEDGGLQIDSATIVSSGTPANKIIDAIKASEEITVEALVKPANTVQDGPARIVTLSADAYYRNFTLGQGLWEDQPSNLYDIRLRTSGTDTNGKPSLSSPAGSLTTALTHVVFTRDKSGNGRIYLNGTLAASGTITGDLTGWAAYQLSLGNEMSGDRPWLGTFHMVAFYDKAMDAAQIKRLNELNAINEQQNTNTGSNTDGDGQNNNTEVGNDSNSNDGQSVPGGGIRRYEYDRNGNLLRVTR